MLSVDADRIREATASGSIRPGMLLERTSTAKTLKAHSVAGGNAERMFAIEDYTQGGDLADTYTTANKFLYIHCKAGDRVAALITEDSSAAGGDVNIGDPLESAGTGALRVHSADSAGAVEFPEAIVAYADEAIDMSDSSGVHGRGHAAVVVA
jgi:hypothetical protein